MDPTLKRKADWIDGGDQNPARAPPQQHQAAGFLDTVLGPILAPDDISGQDVFSSEYPTFDDNYLYSNQIHIPLENWAPPVPISFHGDIVLDTERDFDRTPAQFSEQTVTPQHELADGSQSPRLEPINPEDGQVVCYGLLPLVKAQLAWPPKSAKHVGADTYTSIKIELKDNHGLLHTTAGDSSRSFAILDDTTFKALSPCASIETFRIEAWIAPDEWNKKVVDTENLRPDDRKKTLIQLELLLFGPRGSGDRVATNLGKHHVYLQQPPEERLIAGVHENPQSLYVPNPAPFNDDIWGRTDPNATTFGMDERGRVTDQGSGNARDGSRVQVQGILDAVFDTETPFQPATVVTPSKSITVQMLSHQKDGLGFMLQRETASTVETARLWQKKTFEDGTTGYEHTITGTKKETADDFQGGILADHMGLGKTLTTLSAIIQSGDRARDFQSRVAQQQPGKNTASKATLVVVPSEVVMSTWEAEITKHLEHGAVCFIKYHGPNRREFFERNREKLDIILTTYGTVLAESRKMSESVLYQTEWFRLVLDEAHVIRNMSTKQFGAVESIPSKIRWCLTGTPIQNSLDDLGALLRFLRMPVLQDTTAYRKYITRICSPRSKKEPETICLDGDGFQNLRLILSSVCLRRNRSLLLNQGYIKVSCNPDFTQQENNHYIALLQAYKRARDFSLERQSNEDGPQGRNDHQVMTALLRLRIFCNNGWNNKLRPEQVAFRASSRPDEFLSYLQQMNEGMCKLCTVDVDEIRNSRDGQDSEGAIVTHCWRLVCAECIPVYRAGRQCQDQNSRAFKCPICRSYHGEESVLDNELLDSTPATAEKGEFSSKVKSLVQNIKERQQLEKCVVFSFWKETLNIVSRALDEEGIKYLRVDGGTPAKQRVGKLEQFQKETCWRVMLITFNTGALGLNGLTVAERIHILEPQWNPAQEDQAIGRLLRLDQKRKVTVVRYAMKESIEESVQSRQIQKDFLARSGFANEDAREEGQE